MIESNRQQPAHSEFAPVLFALEQQLNELDRLGSLVAAAHVDAAIQQVRRDQLERP